MKQPVTRRDVIIKHRSPQITVVRQKPPQPTINKMVIRPAEKPAQPAKPPQPPVKPARPAIKTIQIRRQEAARRHRLQMSEKHRKMGPVSFASIGRLKDVGRDRILIIVGNGPSITEAPLEKLKDVEPIDIMSINKPDPRVWPTKWWAFCDQSQYVRHPEQWKHEEVHVINSTSVRARRANQTMVRSRAGKGFSKDLINGYHIGRSSCYAAMQIAWFMNYSRVFLFGVDMNPEGLNGKLHWFGTNPDVKPELRAKRFKYEAESYQWAADHLTPSDRERYVFCSLCNPWPFVEAFGGKKNHKTVIDEEILPLAEQMKKSK